MWSGSYTSSPFSNNSSSYQYISLGRLDTADNPVDRSRTTVGPLRQENCDNLESVPGTETGPGDESGGRWSSLHDGVCLRITNNHPVQTVYVRYWDDGDGDGGDEGYPFTCSGIAQVADYEIPAGESAYFRRNGDIITGSSDSCPIIADPIPTLSQWGVITLCMILLIFGVIAVRQPGLRYS